MTGRRTNKGPFRPGMTLIELTVVILMLMFLAGILFIGTQAWKKGSDRSVCILNIYTVQKGVRSFANLYGLEPGSSAPGLLAQVVGPGRFVESDIQCPSSGDYLYGEASGENTIPPLGEIYMNCSRQDDLAHLPANHTGW